MSAKAFALALLFTALPALAQPAKPVIITPNWAVASLLTMLGHPPLAMGDKRIYPRWESTVAQPDSVIDMGARWQPNRELLSQLRYNGVISNFFYDHLKPLYPKDTAFTEVLFDEGNENPAQSWQSYARQTLKVGRAIDDEPAARAYLENARAQMQAIGRQVRAAAPAVKSYAVVQFSDARHLRLYNDNSLFHAAFTEMGLAQETLGRPVGSRWGNTEITLADLQKLPADSCLLIIGPFSPLTQAGLKKSYLWQRMGFADGARCVRKLPAVWVFGGPDAILHFSQAFGRAMTEAQ